MKDVEAEKKHNPSAKYQYLAVFVVDILFFCYGISCGWASPSLMILESDSSPLPTGKITTYEASWVASLVNAGGVFGTLFFGPIANKFGRKNPLIVITIPTILCWTGILYAQNVYYLYIARFANGFIGAGYFVMGPLFFSEIASDSIRGLLGSSILLILNIGMLLGNWAMIRGIFGSTILLIFYIMLLAFVLGHYCDFFVMPKVVIALVAICGVLLNFFHESPNFLTRQNKIAEAEKSIRFYRNIPDGMDDDIIQDELNKLKKAVGNVSGEMKNNSFKWSNISTKTCRRALTLGIVLAILSRCSGLTALQTYTANIFEESGSNLAPNMATIVVGVIQLAGSYVATLLVERTGRKFLFAVSAIGTGVGLTTLGIYMMLKTNNYDLDAFTWVPVASVSFTIFIASWAVLSLPFLVIAEIMPEQIKEFGVMFCTFLVWFLSFVTVKFFPNLNDTFGFHGTMFLFAAVCLFSLIYLIIYMPETKNRSREEIVKLL